MIFDDLFENRSLVALKLKDYLRDRGYTKVSFSSLTGISRPTLDKILSGSIDSKTTFDKHMQKILKHLNVSVYDLMLYSGKNRKEVEAVFSQNAPEQHKMSEMAVKQYNLMLDIVDLCAIYY